MTKPLLLSFLALVLGFSTGCASSKKSRAKENAAIAADVEESFRKRWVDKRVTELTAQGPITAVAARLQAENEFTERYGFTQKQPKK